MFILVSYSSRKVIVSGTCAKTVHCENCGQPYTYKMKRDALGEDRSLFSWDDRSAYRKAENDGQRNLQLRFEREEDAVACPDCDWVQRSMIESVRRRSYTGLRNMSRAGFVMGGLLLLGSLILYACRQANGRLTTDGEVALVMFGLVTSLLMLIPSAAFWALRDLLNKRFDPNRGAHFRGAAGGN